MYGLSTSRDRPSVKTMKLRQDAGASKSGRCKVTSGYAKPGVEVCEFNDPKIYGDVQIFSEPEDNLATNNFKR